MTNSSVTSHNNVSNIGKKLCYLFVTRTEKKFQKILIFFNEGIMKLNFSILFCRYKILLKNIFGISEEEWCTSNIYNDDRNIHKIMFISLGLYFFRRHQVINFIQ